MNCCKHTLFPCIFTLSEDFLWGRFCIRTRKKSPRKIKYQNSRTFSPETFYFKDFFPEDLYWVPKCRTLFPKLFSHWYSVTLSRKEFFIYTLWHKQKTATKKSIKIYLFGPPRTLHYNLKFIQFIFTVLQHTR